jgi:hypothetical protein
MVLVEYVKQGIPFTLSIKLQNGPVPAADRASEPCQCHAPNTGRDGLWITELLDFVRHG